MNTGSIPELAWHYRAAEWLEKGPSKLSRDVESLAIVGLSGAAGFGVGIAVDAVAFPDYDMYGDMTVRVQNLEADRQTLANSLTLVDPKDQAAIQGIQNQIQRYSTSIAEASVAIPASYSPNTEAALAGGSGLVVGVLTFYALTKFCISYANKAQALRAKLEKKN